MAPRERRDLPWIITAFAIVVMAVVLAVAVIGWR